MRWLANRLADSGRSALMADHAAVRRGRRGSAGSEGEELLTMPKLSLTTILAAIAAGIAAAAHALPEPYCSIGLAIAVALAACSGPKR